MSTLVRRGRAQESRTISAHDRPGPGAGGGDARRGHRGDAASSPPARHARAPRPGGGVLLGRGGIGAGAHPADARRADQSGAAPCCAGPTAARPSSCGRCGRTAPPPTPTSASAIACCGSTASRSPTAGALIARHDRLFPGEVVTFDIERDGQPLTRRVTARPVLAGRWQWTGVAVRVLLVFALFLGIPSLVFKWRPHDPRAMLFMLFGSTFGLSMLNFSVPGLSQPPESVMPLPDAFTRFNLTVAGDHVRVRARDQPDAAAFPGAVPAAAPSPRCPSGACCAGPT